MQNAHQKLLLWISVGLFIPGMIAFAGVARFVPLPQAYLTAEEVAQLYQANLFGIRAGIVFFMVGATGLAFLFSVFVAQVRRIPGLSDTIPSALILLGAVNVMLMIIPGIMWEIAAFRPDRPVEITQALNDTGWILAIMPAGSFILYQIVAAIACFADKEERILPRWLGYVSLWTAVIYVPAYGANFFKTGPFAWHGLLAFYLVVTAFVVWLICTFVTMFKALNYTDNSNSI